MSRTPRCGMRKLRRNLRAHLKTKAPVVIDSDYNLRAILVPIPEHSNWSRAERVKAIATANRQFKAVIRALSAES